MPILASACSGEAAHLETERSSVKGERPVLVRMELRSLYAHDGELYLRYRLPAA